MITIKVEVTKKVEHVIQYKRMNSKTVFRFHFSMKQIPEYYQMTLHTKDNKRLIIPMNDIIHMKTPNGKSIIKGKSI